MVKNESLYIHTGWDTMTKSHPERSLTLKQIYADTAALRRINAEMKKELAGELKFDIDMQKDLDKSEMESLENQVDFAIENGMV